jgi:hypothetical protein
MPKEIEGDNDALENQDIIPANTGGSDSAGNNDNADDPFAAADAEFDAAFMEAVKESDAELTPAINQGNDSHDDKKTGSDAENNAAVVAAAEALGKKDESAASNAQGLAQEQNADGGAGKTAQDSGNDETYEQRWKTLQGIWHHDKESWEIEKAQLHAQIETLKSVPAKKDSSTSASSVASDAAVSIMDQLTDAEKAELEDYDAEFGLVSQMEGKKRDKALHILEDKLNHRLDELFNQVKPVVDFLPIIPEVQKRFKESDEELHFSTIANVHEDFEAYVDNGSLLKWIEGKPKYLQPGLLNVYEKGTPQDVIDMITDFKNDSGIALKGQVDQASLDAVTHLADNSDRMQRRENKRAALTAVKTKQRSVDIDAAVANDFDSAFDEAIRKQGG